jgi:hypothetical protein
MPNPEQATTVAYWCPNSDSQIVLCLCERVQMIAEDPSAIVKLTPTSTAGRAEPSVKLPFWRIRADGAQAALPELAS